MEIDRVRTQLTGIGWGRGSGWFHKDRVGARIALEIGDALREVACAINNLAPIPLTDQEKDDNLARIREVVAEEIKEIMGLVS